MKKRFLICSLFLFSLLTALFLTCGAASAPIAEICAGNQVLSTVDDLAEAVEAAAAKTGCTLKLTADATADALDLSGTYAIDLNGHTISVSDALLVKSGIVTVLDSSASAKGKIVAKDTAAVKLQGGDLLVRGGTISTENGTYVIENEGDGVLYLAAKPKIDGTVFAKNAGAVCANDGTKIPQRYTGELINVYCGWEATEGDVAVKGGTADRFSVTNQGFFQIKEKDGDLVTTRMNYIGWGAAALLLIGALLLLIFTIRHTERVDKKIAKLNSIALPFTIPAVLPFMAYMGELEKLILLAAAGLFVMALFYAIISFPHANSKLKKAVAAAEKKQKDAAAAAPAPAPVAEESAAAEVAQAPAEEAAEEVAEEAAEEVAAEEPKEYAPLEANVPVVCAETGKTLAYSTYRRSFLARIIVCPADVQERYDALKNALLSYKKVTSRVSWSYESIKAGRKQLAKFAICGKTLCLFLAIDPATLGESKYNIADMSGSKKYETVPCRLRLTSKRSVKWGLELIAKMAENEQLVQNAKYKAVSYVPANEPDEVLLEKGLIKKVQ